MFFEGVPNNFTLLPFLSVFLLEVSYGLFVFTGSLEHHLCFLYEFTS